MACFCSEDSRGDDRRAKFSLVYEIRASKADGDDVTAVSLTRRALYNTMAFDPRKVLEEPNFCKNFIYDNKISYTCRMECQQHTEKRIMWFCSMIAKLGSSKTIRGSNAIVLCGARPSEGAVSDVILN